MNSPPASFQVNTVAMKFTRPRSFRNIHRLIFRTERDERRQERRKDEREEETE